jgi:endonuclease YncB( thermonuclease family)
MDSEFINIKSEFIKAKSEEIKKLQSVTKAQPFSLEGKYIAKVTDVYDGDTCKAAIIGVMGSSDPFEFRIRMLLYNAEEIKQSTKLDDATRAHQHAVALEQKQKLSDLILNQIVIVDCRKFDAFGRLLSFLYKPNDSTSINDQMIQAFPDIKRIPYE